MKALTYYQRNKAKVLRKTRQTRLTSRGGKVYQHLKKRPHPGHCELCLQPHCRPLAPERLEYHHWDDNRPSIGMWLCNACHRLAGALEHPCFALYHTRYSELRDRIETHYHELEPLYSRKWKRK